MDGFTLLAELVKALAWPVTVVSSIVMLRVPLGRLISILSRFRYGDLELQFGKEIAQLAETAGSIPTVAEDGDVQATRQRILQIGAVSPKAAVIEAWRSLEGKLVDAAARHGIEEDSNASRKPLELAKQLLTKQVIDTAQYELLHQLRVLRNEAAHYEKMRLSVDGAVAYTELSLKLAASIR